MDIPTQELTKTANDGINNPLNIRATDNAWFGKITTNGAKFEQFDAMWKGFRAGMKNVVNVAKQTTNQDFTDTIAKLSPNSDNNNDAVYTSQVKSMAGIDATESIPDMSEATFKAMIKAMAYVEQGSNFVVNEADIDAAYEDLQNEKFFA